MMSSVMFCTTLRSCPVSQTTWNLSCQYSAEFHSKVENGPKKPNCLCSEIHLCFSFEWQPPVLRLYAEKRVQNVPGMLVSHCFELCFNFYIWTKISFNLFLYLASLLLEYFLFQTNYISELCPNGTYLYTKLLESLLKQVQVVFQSTPHEVFFWSGTLKQPTLQYPHNCLISENLTLNYRGL